MTPTSAVESITIASPLPHDHFTKKVEQQQQKIWSRTFSVIAGLTLPAITATVLIGGQLATTCLIITTVALGLLLIYKALERLIPKLSGKPRQIAHYLIAPFIIVSVLVPIILRYPFSLARKEDQILKKQITEGKTIPTPSDKPPVLLVHGFLSNSSNWYWQKQRLQEAGLTVYTVDLGWRFLGSPLKSIEEYATVIKAKAELIAKVHGTNRLNLIGHSLGGLVAFQYKKALAPTNSVEKILTIGSPIQGTVIARIAVVASLGFSKCAKQMCVGSPFTEKLKALGADELAKIYSFTSSTDEMIWSRETSQFKGQPPANIHHFELMTHVQYLLSGRLTDQLIAILTSSPGL